MKKLLFLVLFLLIACTPSTPDGVSPAGTITFNNDTAVWSYIHGPHGENCLLLSYHLGSTYGWASISCDSVRPEK